MSPTLSLFVQGLLESSLSFGPSFPPPDLPGADGPDGSPTSGLGTDSRHREWLGHRRKESPPCSSTRCRGSAPDVSSNGWRTGSCGWRCPTLRTVAWDSSYWTIRRWRTTGVYLRHPSCPSSRHPAGSRPPPAVPHPRTLLQEPSTEGHSQ